MAKFNPWSLFDTASRPSAFGLNGRVLDYAINPGILDQVDAEAVAAMNKQPVNVPVEKFETYPAIESDAESAVPVAVKKPLIEAASPVPIDAKDIPANIAPSPEPVMAGKSPAEKETNLSFEGMDFDSVPRGDMQINARRYYNDTPRQIRDADFTKPGNSITQNDSNEFKNLTSNRLAVDPREYIRAEALIKSSDEYRQQQQAINDYEKLGAILASQPVENEGWLKPLIALTDSQTGSNLMKGYEPGTSARERNQITLKYASDVAKRRGELTQMAIKGAQNLLADNVTNQILQKAGLITAIGKASPFAAITERQDRIDHRTAVENVKKNPILQKQLLTANAVITGFDQIDKMELTSPQQIAEAMQVVRNATTGLTGGTKSGVSERAETYMSNLWRDFDNLKQRYGGTVENIPADDPQLIQIKKELIQANKSITNEYWKLIDAVTKGYGFVYQRHPEWMADLMDVMDAYKGLLSPHGNMSNKAVDSKARSAKKTSEKLTKPIQGGDPGMDAFLNSKGKK